MVRGLRHLSYRALLNQDSGSVGWEEEINWEGWEEEEEGRDKKRGRNELDRRRSDGEQKVQEQMIKSFPFLFFFT